MPGTVDQDELDRLVRRTDLDRWLTTRFIGDAAARADVIALYAYDHELARARVAASNAILAEMRLTWWSEVLDEIFAGGAVRRHPTALALADTVRRRNLPRDPLEAMIDGRIHTLDFLVLDVDSAMHWASRVHGSAAELAATILDPAAPVAAARPAGRAWGLALLGRLGQGSPDDLKGPLGEALAEAAAGARTLGVRAFPAVLPARLARFDLGGRAPGPLRKQVSLVVAAATGRI